MGFARLEPEPPVAVQDEGQDGGTHWKPSWHGSVVGGLQQGSLRPAGLKLSVSEPSPIFCFC